MLSILSAGFWLAKGAGLRAGLGRFWNGSSAKAVAIAVTALAVLIGGALFWWAAREGAASARDALWRAKVAVASIKARDLEIVRQRRVDQAAERERAAVEDRDAMRERVADLEQTLTALERAADACGGRDPVVFPPDLVRSLKR